MIVSETRKANKLINEPSPYLQQHAFNPVNWYPWGDTPFQLASKMNKPVILSIGYSSCHWCHVMERESFENVEVADYMNNNFICIKLDREERPDIDQIYMSAVQAMTGSGGWPLNVFLTPDKKPFLGGTYYPPKPYSNIPSWMQVLSFVNDVWENERSKVLNQSNYLSDFLKSEPILAQNQDSQLKLSDELFQVVFHNIKQQFDSQNGGFGSAPKFLNTFTLQFLLRYHFYTGNKEAIDHVDKSLRKMCSGGIYDHIGGGFARYSTDIHWFVPHFEKMLYDNALMVNVLCEAYQVTGNEMYKDVVLQTIEFLTSDFMSADHLFYSALDADSDGVEGKYYVWNKSEIDNLLGHDAEIFCDYFSLSHEGNWESTNILYHDGNLEQLSVKYNICPSELVRRIGFMLQKLQVARKSRVSPSLDTKTVLSWNALVISSLCKAYKVFNQDIHLQTATKLIHSILNFMYNEKDESLYHNYCNGKAYNIALLDDYAFFIKSLIDYYEVDFDIKWIDLANHFTSIVFKKFKDNEDFLFFYTPSDLTDVIARKKDLHDGVTPAGNSVMLSNLYRLYRISGLENYKESYEGIVSKIISIVEKFPLSFSNYASELITIHRPLPEVVIIGKDYSNLVRDLGKKFLPGLVLLASEVQTKSLPLFINRGNFGETISYICHNQTCDLPIENQNNLNSVLSQKLTKCKFNEHTFHDR